MFAAQLATASATKLKVTSEHVWSLV